MASTPKVPFLNLPFELRQQIYTTTLRTTLSLTDARLSRSPTLEEIAFLASRLGTWSLTLTCRLISAETLPLRWPQLTILLARDGTRSPGDDGRHRLGNADQAFRRRVRRLEVSDPEAFGTCYGLRRLSGLQSLVFDVERVDGWLLEGKLMGVPDPGVYVHGLEAAKGRRLRLEVKVVEEKGFEVGMFTSAITTSVEVQRRWRLDALRREGRMPYVWLGDTIWQLPAGCAITIRARIVNATWDVLKDLEDFRIISTGRDSWSLTYNDEI
jgi:hypothetical protein